MMAFEIEGKIVFQPLEGGFWGIEDTEGGRWLPVEMPAGLKKEGLRVRIRAMERDDLFSASMWGTYIRILSYRTEA